MGFWKKSSQKIKIASDWRKDIPQRIRTGGTRPSKRRRYTSWAGTILICIITLGAISIFALTWAHIIGDSSDEGFTPLHVEMQTDGVLDNKWFQEWTGINYGTKDVSIVNLRKKLESYGQVRSAEVKRGRNNSLLIELRERNAIARVKFQSGKVKILSEDGVLFPAETFPVAQDKLPFITHMRVSTRDGLEYGVGIDTLLAFLKLVRQNYPEMLLEWLSISVRDLPSEILEKDLPQPWAVLRVRTLPSRMNPSLPKIVEIVFSAQNFSEELALWCSQDAQAKLEQYFAEERETNYRVFFITNRKNAHRPILESRIIPILDERERE